jgi:hypothetical protein
MVQRYPRAETQWNRAAAPDSPYDAERDKRLIFLTNDFILPATAMHPALPEDTHFE